MIALNKNIHLYIMYIIISPLAKIKDDFKCIQFFRDKNGTYLYI